MTTKLALEAGCLYQVKHWKKGWIIAQYVKEIAPHTYKYHNFDMNSFKVGKEHTRSVPLSHSWLCVRGFDRFTLEDKTMEVRACTQEALDTIDRLKREIAQLEENRKAKTRELVEFCE